MTNSNLSDTELVIEFFKQWTILADHGMKGGPILPKTNFEGPTNRNYQLKSGRIRKFLQWEDQKGMNIGWTNNAEPKTATKVQRWFFMRNSENETPLRYGETIAIGNGKSPSFLHYEKRTIGVNLQWHEAPAFQWKLLGGASGTQIKIGDWLAIYNKKSKECFIFVDRTMGGDVGWPSSKTWSEQALQKIKDELELEKLAVTAIKTLLLA